MEKRKRYLLAATGMSGNGKSTQLDLIAVALGISYSNGRIVRVEMSGIIRWGLRLLNALGEEVRAQKSLMDRGAYLTDDVAIPLFRAWLEMIDERYPEAETFLIGGMPRTTRQKDELLALFDAYAIIDIGIDPQQAIESIAERAKRSSNATLRSDDAGGVTVFSHRLIEWERHTLPMLGELNGERIELLREEHPLERTTKTLTHIRRMKTPIMSRYIAKKALKRVRLGSKQPHRIHRECGNVHQGQGITPNLVPHLHF